MRPSLPLRCCLLLLLCWTGQNLPAQPHGLETPEPVGPFLDNRLPSRRPGSTLSTSGARLVNAFPNLTFVDPIFLLAEPVTRRLIVIEHGGKIWSFPNDPQVAQASRTLILDLSARTKSSQAGGIKSLAFHPEYGQPGSPNRHYLYVCYRAAPPPLVTSETQIEGYNRVSRFTVAAPGGLVDASSEVVLIQQFDAHHWHDAGALVFGPDRFVYVSLGDMGGSDDAFDVAQSITSGFFSGILRIDVDRDPARSHPIRRQPRNPRAPPAGWPATFSNASAVDGYFIPNDNPWQDTEGGVLEEFYAIGLRNAHRMTLDRITGNIWLGEVGEGSREEVNLLKKGANYQWPYREGSLTGRKPRPTQVLGIETPPVHEYQRDKGNCVIGGYVYRGARFAAQLEGKYIFADNGSQSVWELAYTPGLPGQVEEVVVGPNGNELSGLSSLGEDADGELYVLKLNGFKSGGATILQLEPDTEFQTAPALLSELGAFADPANLTARPGFIPYDVNNALWSDGAHKKRWVAIPNNGSANTLAEQIRYAENSEWEFPVGTVFMKHFMLPADERNPTAATMRWLETRFLVHATDGQYYGLTYRWREDRSDADLLAQSLDEPVSLVDHQGAVQQILWHYPSRSQCLTCHSQAARQVLGLNTRQLNRQHFYESTGVSDNQLRTLNHLGFLQPSIQEAQIPAFLTAAALTDENATIEHRARSYLDSNCSQCHRPGGVRANFDARLVTPLVLQNLVFGPVGNALGIEGARNVFPRDESRSILFQRLNTLDSCCAMPPLAKSRLDATAVELIAQWIRGIDPNAYPSGCPCRLWLETDAPPDPGSSDPEAVELGVKLETLENGYILGVRFYKGPENNGQHRGNLWTSAGTLLATALFDNETSIGWQTAIFPTPVAVTPGEIYVASYHAPFGHYATTLDYFRDGGVNAPPLRAPPAVEVGGNGVYRYGPTSSFPDQTYRSANYWVDVVFGQTLPGSTPLFVASTTPASEAQNVPVSTPIAATLSAALDPSSVSGATVELRDAAAAQIPALVQYDEAGTVIYLVPEATLLPGTTYTATLKGGANGIKKLAGDALVLSYAWSFTTRSIVVPGRFLRADTNGDGTVDISDAIRSLLHLYQGLPGVIICDDALDANDDGVANLTDVIYTLDFLFQQGPRPPAPYPTGDIDPTPDSLGCDASP